MAFNVTEIDGVIVGPNNRFPVDVITTTSSHAINDLITHTGVLDDVQIPAGIMRDNEHQSDAHTMTIDGRDVSIDGIKLDTIETGAEVNNISDVNVTGLTGGGNTSLHIHDSRYYTETEISASNPGTVTIHWDNITNVPPLGGGSNWLSPVDTKYDGTAAPTGTTPTGSEGDRIIWYSGTGNNQHVYEIQGGVWIDEHTPVLDETVLVIDDGDGAPAQYWFDGTDWIKIADSYNDHGEMSGLADDDHVQYLNETRHDALLHDNPHNVTFTQVVTADPAVDITTIEIETLTNGSEASGLHIHDDRYYTETELDAGQLDGRYYTETELNSIVDGSSGADIIRATIVGTGSETTVQGILEELQTQIDIISGGMPSANYNQYFFGDKKESGLVFGRIPGMNGTTIGYKLPRAQTLKSISILTDAINSNTYSIEKNGVAVKNIAFSGESEKIEDLVDIAFAKGDTVTAYLDIESSQYDFNNQYTCDANTLFLAHVDGDDNDLRMFTNDCENVNGITGRLVGGVTLGASGNFSNCASFNGDDGYIKFLHNIAFESQDATVEFLFNPNSTVGNQVMFSKESSGSGDGGHLIIGLQGSKVWIKSSSSGKEKLEKSIEKNITTGQWYHIALVFGASGFKSYLSGISLYEDPSWTQGLNGNREMIVLGMNNDSSKKSIVESGTQKEFFNGLIDELRISKSRRYETAFTVPTSAFISDIYTVGLWHLDETSGNVVYDSCDEVIQHFMFQTTGSFSQVKTDIFKFGTSSLKFNNSMNDWIKGGHNTEFEVIEFSVETWLYIEVDATGVIFQKGDPLISEGALNVRWIKTDKRIEVNYRGISTTITLTTANNIFPMTEFHHVLVSLDASSINLIVDGIEKDSAVLSADFQNVMQNNTDDIYIGKSASSTDFLRAYIDEYRIHGSKLGGVSTDTHEITLVTNFSG